MIDKLTGANISSAVSGLNKNMQDGAKNSRTIKKMDAGFDKGIRRAANGMSGAINKVSGGKIRLPRVRAMSRTNERNIAAINKEDKEITEGLALANAEILRVKYGSQDEINVAVGDSLVSAIKTGDKKDINEATLTATASNMSPADIAVHMRRGLIAATDGEKKKQAAIAIMSQFGDKLKELSPSTHAFVKEVSEKAVGEARGYDEVKNDFDTWRNVGVEMANFRGDEADRFSEALYDMQSRGDISSANTIGNVAKKMLEDPNAKWSAGQMSNLNRFAKYAESPSKSVDRPTYDDQSQKKSNQESSTTNQGRSMFIDNINYGESFIVPKNDNKQASQPRGPRRWR